MQSHDESENARRSLDDLSRFFPALYQVDQARSIDRQAIESGTSGFDLMKQAGEASFQTIQSHWPDTRTLWVFCGMGNNGGDGAVVAGLAHQAGWMVHWFYSGDPEQLKNEAKEAYQWCLAQGLKVEPIVDELGHNGLIVDALLGIGADRRLDDEFQSLIDQINRTDMPVLSLDIPSGLHGDTGKALGRPVQADRTISFIVHKTGLFTGDSAGAVGHEELAPLHFDPQVRKQHQPVAHLVGYQRIKTEITCTRKRVSHKGEFGHVKLLGGLLPGAIYLAAEGACRSGAGLVSVALPEKWSNGLLARLPQVMVESLEELESIQQFVSVDDTLVMGPGLGQSQMAKQFLQEAILLQSPLLLKGPLVLDADALNLLSQLENKEGLAGRPSVMTPHPGEAARLLDTSIEEIQKDRFSAVKRLATRYHSAVVLKGAGTLVSDGKVIRVLEGGNPGMAVGGMGDVLAGIIGVQLAQGYSPLDAATLGVSIHNQAADVAARHGEKGMSPTDVVQTIRAVIN